MTRLFFSLLVVLLVAAGPASAQEADTAAAADAAVVSEGQGRATLVDWPRSLSGLLDEMGRKAPYLMPRIDSLALDYRYAAGDSASQWSFVLGWRPGDRVLYEGEVLPRRRAPSGVRMVNVELRAEVRAGAEAVGEMIVAVDSMRLAPFPSIYAFEVQVPHDRVFLDTPGETARRALRQGVTLHDLVVERMGFRSDARSTSERGRAPDAKERRPAPRSGPSVYEPATRILIGWRVAPRPYYVDVRDGRRTQRAPDETVGRTPAPEDARERPVDRGDRPATAEGGDEGRGERSGGGTADEDDDDEDDDTSLRLPALGAAAAVGLVAVAGGSVGLYGRGDTPIGLAAGYTRPRGGIQLQAAVNSAVIEDAPNQKLTLKALGFYDVFESRVQPAVGLGLQIDPARDRDVRPALSLGLAANFAKVVVFGGVDVVHNTPEVGVVYNFRYREPEAERTGEQE